MTEPSAAAVSWAHDVLDDLDNYIDHGWGIREQAEAIVALALDAFARERCDSREWQAAFRAREAAVEDAVKSECTYAMRLALSAREAVVWEAAATLIEKMEYLPDCKTICDHGEQPLDCLVAALRARAAARGGDDELRHQD